jgi:hypothetical protein
MTPVADTTVELIVSESENDEEFHDATDFPILSAFHPLAASSPIAARADDASLLGVGKRVKKSSAKGRQEPIFSDSSTQHKTPKKTRGVPNKKRGQGGPAGELAPVTRKSTTAAKKKKDKKTPDRSVEEDERDDLDYQDACALYAQLRDDYHRALAAQQANRELLYWASECDLPIRLWVPQTPQEIQLMAYIEPPVRPVSKRLTPAANLRRRLRAEREAQQHSDNVSVDY